MVFEKITKKFYNKGLSFKEFLDHPMMKPDDRKRVETYYDRAEKEFNPSDFRIHLKNPL